MGAYNSKISDRDRSILKIKEQRDKLIRYHKRLERIEQLEVNLARKCLVDNDRKGALKALSAKKFYSGLIEQSYGQLGNIEQLLSSIEFTLIQQDVLFGLQEGSSVLQQLQKEMPLERIDKICNDRDEASQYVEEVNVMLQGKMSRDQEDEIQAELDALIQEQDHHPNERQLEEKHPTLPTVPQTKPNSAAEVNSETLFHPDYIPSAADDDKRQALPS
ncbi:vacuolar sorting protein Vps20 [Schizosaccharomyces cryophilus OY26]|uniref:Vacuolar sorting protein Vps20 n=1 Tax=Schizosaccharomyces cryophilus (strain OY26 / ATCC MYA-4695 / CBS 11777 / NBRC 106824 / NRRL Y48691) TaxID=653667 RepID=S9XIS6_SCHCR|nr:vacuolar sorting protein Vps20 [Schizosaccharomyces cryophilus OY26]EPY53536.1 vacuolar sorting protein Vps20 [Schizosaccharomyces cryophilus OY26]